MLKLGLDDRVGVARRTCSAFDAQAQSASGSERRAGRPPQSEMMGRPPDLLGIRGPKRSASGRECRAGRPPQSEMMGSSAGPARHSRPLSVRKWPRKQSRSPAIVRNDGQIVAAPKDSQRQGVDDRFFSTMLPQTLIGLDVARGRPPDLLGIGGPSAVR